VAAGILVDTNVLVYAHDPADLGKQARAITVLAGLAERHAGVLAAQSLAEFYWTTTRARRPLLTAAEAEAQVDRLAASWPVLDLTPAIVCEAVRGVRRHRLAYWDAQIWAAARLNQVQLVLSEDFADRARLEGVRFVNPFRRDFAVDAVLAEERQVGPGARLSGGSLRDR
jgi:predicted nucleic acid-binding protein